jgi:hypothetical protein
MLQSSEFLHVSLAHRYWKREWDGERNRLVYGPSASPEGIGSNMILQLRAKGDAPVDFTAALKALKAQVDHRCLFEDVERFQSEPSTLERVTEFLAQSAFAQALPDGQSWFSLSVSENPWMLARAFADASDLEMEIRVHNLTLQLRGSVDPATGLLLERGTVESAVKNLNLKPTELSSRAWAEDLLFKLKSKVKNLKGVTVDLGRQEKIIVTSES